MSAPTTERTRKALAKHGITSESIAAIQREVAAYHEAGHAVVALAMGAQGVGVQVHAPCFRNGVCNMLAAYRPSSRPAIGIAGMVADAIKNDYWSEHFESDYSMGDFSQSDMDAIGDAPFQKVANVAHAILSLQWDFVERIAQALLEKKNLTASEVLDLEAAQ